MIDRAQAVRIAEQHIEKICSDVPGGVTLMMEKIIETAYGWVFFFNSRRFLENGNPLDALGGNSPFVVESNTGKITPLGTALPVAESLRLFEQELAARPSSKTNRQG